MSEEKKSFLGSIADQLLKWDRQIDELKKKAIDETGGKKENIAKQIKELIEKKENLKNKADEIRRTGEEAWKTAKDGIEKASHELSASLKSILNSLNKKDTH